MDRQPFRFAIQATNATGAREWCDFVCRVEELGYSTLFLADHYLGPGPAQRAALTPRQDLAPIAAIAAAAAHTSVLRVGCRVFCVDYHVPAVLAKEIATLDLLSDGRLEVGIGAGWSGGEYEAMGVAFDTPGRRIAKLKEVVDLVKAHCAGDELAFAGDYVNVNGYKGTPRPVQRPHPPIMIGGMGEQKTLRLVAKYADACNLFPTPQVAHKLDVLKRHCEREKRNYDDIEKTTMFGFDVGERGENVSAIVERLRGLARMGFVTAIGGVRDAHKIVPLEIIAREIIPAVAAF